MDLGKALGRNIPYASLLGIALRSRGDGRAELELTLRPELMNSWDSAHGGVIMTLLDIAMAVAARSADPKALGAITVEMKTTFIGPSRGTLVAAGVCIYSGSSVSFCEGEVRDESGRVVARASGTFMVRRGRPAAESLPPDAVAGA
jgi:uncharacterized protein (TIGR00369 family)